MSRRRQEPWKKHKIIIENNYWVVKFESDKLKNKKFKSKSELEDYLDWLQNAEYA